MDLRWSIERFPEDIKQHLGSIEFQGRSWDEFHRHLAFVMLAHAFISTHRLEAGHDQPSFETVMQRIVCKAAIPTTDGESKLRPKDVDRRS